MSIASPSTHVVEIDVKNGTMSVEHPSVKKMVFVMNALEQGWTVKKRKNKFIFKKKHHGNKEVWKEDYLDNFIETNMNPNTFFS